MVLDKERTRVAECASYRFLLVADDGSHGGHTPRVLWQSGTDRLGRDRKLATRGRAYIIRIAESLIFASAGDLEGCKIEKLKPITFVELARLGHHLCCGSGLL